MERKHASPFQMNFYVRFRYVPGTEMEKYFPDDEYWAGFNTRQEAKAHLRDALEREDVKYESKIFTKKELNKESP
jgi:hypothetical protein